MRGWRAELEWKHGGGERQTAWRCVLKTEVTGLADQGEGKEEEEGVTQVLGLHS